MSGSRPSMLLLCLALLGLTHGSDQPSISKPVYSERAAQALSRRRARSASPPVTPTVDAEVFTDGPIVRQDQNVQAVAPAVQPRLARRLFNKARDFIGAVRGSACARRAQRVLTTRPGNLLVGPAVTAVLATRPMGILARPLLSLASGQLWARVALLHIFAPFFLHRLVVQFAEHREQLIQMAREGFNGRFNIYGPNGEYNGRRVAAFWWTAFGLLMLRMARINGDLNTNQQAQDAMIEALIGALVFPVSGFSLFCFPLSMLMFVRAATGNPHADFLTAATALTT